MKRTLYTVGLTALLLATQSRRARAEEICFKVVSKTTTGWALFSKKHKTFFTLDAEDGRVLRVPYQFTTFREAKNFGGPIMQAMFRASLHPTGALESAPKREPGFHYKFVDRYSTPMEPICAKGTVQAEKRRLIFIPDSVYTKEERDNPRLPPKTIRFFSCQASGKWKNQHFSSQSAKLFDDENFADEMGNLVDDGDIRVTLKTSPRLELLLEVKSTAETYSSQADLTGGVTMNLRSTSDDGLSAYVSCNSYTEKIPQTRKGQ